MKSYDLMLYRAKSSWFWKIRKTCRYTLWARCGISESWTCWYIQ